MSGFAPAILIVFLLTFLGSAVLLTITLKYYWGERGAPPPTGDQRRAQKENELKLRAKQLEHSRSNPREERKPDFFDNTKPRSGSI